MNNYARVFVCELEPGDVTAWGETVDHVERVTDNRTHVHFTNGAISAYGRGTSTVLILPR